MHNTCPQIHIMKIPPVWTSAAELSNSPTKTAQRKTRAKCDVVQIWLIYALDITFKKVSTPNNLTTKVSYILYMYIHIYILCIYVKDRFLKIFFIMDFEKQTIVF